MWTSLGLKFVAMMQLLERTVAVAVGGANVNIREITLVKAQASYKQKRENRSSLFVDQPGLEPGTSRL